MHPLNLQLAILTIILATRSRAQKTCSGQPIAAASDFAARYPAPYTPATGIVAGDTDAQELWNAILATNSPLLQIPPIVMNNGSFDQSQRPDKSTCNWSWTTCTDPDPSTGLAPDYYFCPTPATWGLSIDDGPTCYHNELYDMLAEQNQLASLYYIGSNVYTWPEEAQKGFLGGHEICAHTWSHQYTTTLTNEQVFAELYYTKAIIKEVTGYSTRCLRLSYGDADNRVRFIAAALDMKIHQWDQNTNDWQVGVVGKEGIRENYQNIFKARSPTSGMIVLTHEVNEDTTGLLIEEYPNIVKNFASVVPVSTCQNDTDLFAEDNAPLFVDFADYKMGKRGDPRFQQSFWSKDSVIYVNGTASDFYETQESAHASPILSAPVTAGGLATASASGLAQASVQSQRPTVSTISHSSATGLAPLLSLFLAACIFACRNAL